MRDFKAFKQEFDQVLAERFDARADSFLAIANDPEIAAYLAQTRSILLSGGKRVRPYLVELMQSSLTLGAAPDSLPTMRVGVAVELFHIFALIHDDITDCGEIRHGQPTLHQFGKTLIPNHVNTNRVAEGQAILLGDVVHAWSRAELTDALPDEHLRSCMQIFDVMTDTVVIGQMLDVRTLALNEAPEPLIERKTLLKTAHYTVVSPLRLGASLAGGLTDALDAWIVSFGEALGMAFQLQDDLLDLAGMDTSYGKKTLVDVREGQHTALSTYIRAHSTPEDRETFDAAFGSGETGFDEAAVRSVISRSGVEAYAAARIEELFSKVTELLENAPGPREPWHNLVNALRARVH